MKRALKVFHFSPKTILVRRVESCTLTLTFFLYRTKKIDKF